LFATSRLFFAYALANSLFAGLRLGACVILDPAWPEPEQIARVVQKQRPTLFFSVPTLYHQMLAQGVAQRFADCGVRHFVSAGESLPPQVALRQLREKIRKSLDPGRTFGLGERWEQRSG